MITAVDTNVLLDVFGADARFAPRSAGALRRCLAEGAIVACDVVWAETAAAFPEPDTAREAMSRLGITFDAMNEVSALAAGHAWRSYRAKGGPRGRVVADFLVGAHALIRADRLLSRDRGFYRQYFAQLSLFDPTAP